MGERAGRRTAHRGTARAGPERVLEDLADDFSLLQSWSIAVPADRNDCAAGVAGANRFRRALRGMLAADGGEGGEEMSGAEPSLSTPTPWEPGAAQPQETGPWRAPPESEPSAGPNGVTVWPRPALLTASADAGSGRYGLRCSSSPGLTTWNWPVGRQHRVDQRRASAFVVSRVRARFGYHTALAVALAWRRWQWSGRGTRFHHPVPCALGRGGPGGRTTEPTAHEAEERVRRRQRILPRQHGAACL